ncbi:MAG: 2-oxo acid dehydrogenase subunit E2 [Oscillospiraceae bacterium]|nr:2-oxo acid dehydrogenase subunit E2 [Oscillospiraceae bacterium]
MRRDGKRVFNEDPIYYLIPYFLSKKYDAMNMITLDIPEEPLRAYMNQKRKEGKKISHMALILTAYLRAAEKYPALNRFIVGRKIYEHSEFTVTMAVLKPGTAQDTQSKIHLDYSDDIFSVQDKISSYVEENRKEEEVNGLDRIMPKLIRLNWLLGFVVGLLKLMDRLGLLPKSLIEASPFHASLLISNLASIRTNHIYHHVYQFGTISIAMTMGNLREVPRRTRDGIVFDRCIPLGVVMDERIANGKVFAMAFSEIKRYLSHPELMEHAPGADRE